MYRNIHEQGLSSFHSSATNATPALPSLPGSMMPGALGSNAGIGIGGMGGAGIVVVAKVETK